MSSILREVAVVPNNQAAVMDIKQVDFTPGRCILCSHEHPEQLKTYMVEQAASKWQEEFGIQVKGEFAPHESFSLYRCSHCGLEFSFPSIAASEGFYAVLQHFAWYYMGDKWEFGTALQDIKLGSRVLEIGCGSGAFLRLAAERGVRIEGIELNESAIRQARAEDLPVSNQDLFDLASASPGAYDCVCSFQVLEHVPNPLEFLIASVNLLRPGGRLLISVPNNNSFIRHDQTDLLNQPPHHLTRWAQKSLEYLPDLLPLRLVRVMNEPLAPYHRDWYISVQKRRISDHLPFSHVLQRSWGVLFSLLFKLSSIDRRITGHTIYACFTKTG